MPPSREELVELIAAMGMSVRNFLRQRGTPYDELGLDIRISERSPRKMAKSSIRADHAG